MSNDAVALEAHLREQVGRWLTGMETIVHGLAIAHIGRGHVLLEGAPGLGKTRLSKAFAGVVGGRFKRIQGTADLMPSDMTGVHVYQAASGKFEFQPGPLFADVVLVDEINRAGPKTQSALLEAMEERQVSIDRETFALADEFLVIATQNPREFEGTFPLPESQLDRFALCLQVPYLARAEELAVLADLGASAVAQEGEALRTFPEGLLSRARADVERVHMSEELLGYVLDLAAATRDSASVSIGLSIRGALTLARCARTEAALRGAEFVIPDDVQAVASWVIAHRLVLTAEAAIEGVTATDLVARLLDDVAVPK